MLSYWPDTTLSSYRLPVVLATWPPGAVQTVASFQANHRLALRLLALTSKGSLKSSSDWVSPSRTMHVVRDLDYRSTSPSNHRFPWYLGGRVTQGSNTTGRDYVATLGFCPPRDRCRVLVLLSPRSSWTQKGEVIVYSGKGRTERNLSGVRGILSWSPNDVVLECW